MDDIQNPVTGMPAEPAQPISTPTPTPTPMDTPLPGDAPAAPAPEPVAPGTEGPQV